MPTPLRKPLKNEPHRQQISSAVEEGGRAEVIPPGRHMVGLKSSATVTGSCVWGQPRTYKTRAQHQDTAHRPA
ncbi:hypothetical protein CDAR_77271 [Caerostris darwini]|uniref:Uncharacterized protein n=1 Tax=Caerostris darwini TaxID=1538125 RepID=A0AAV4TS70_9ARAC|nr:hypothetical protein CDAR_77271 [Caerostris darwini]